MWLRPSIGGRPPPTVEVFAGAWVGSAIYTVGGCGEAGYMMVPASVQR